MSANERFNAVLERSREIEAYWVEKAIIECTEEMVERMVIAGISRTELANRLGKKPAFVTKLLRGNNNFTFETAVRIARALDMEFVPHLRPQGWSTRWLDLSPSEVEPQTIPLSKIKERYSRETTEELIGVENETFALGA